MCVDSLTLWSDPYFFSFLFHGNVHGNVHLDGKLEFFVLFVFSSSTVAAHPANYLLTLFGPLNVQATGNSSTRLHFCSVC